MSKQKFRGIYRKMQKSWWEVDMSCSLCLEGNSTADRSEAIIMGWQRFQPLPSPKFSLSKSRWENWSRLFLTFADIWNSKNCRKGGYAWVKQGGMNLFLVPEQQHPWLGEDIGVWAEELEDGKDAFITGWVYTLSISGNKTKKNIKLTFMPKYY